MKNYGCSIIQQTQNVHKRKEIELKIIAQYNSNNNKKINFYTKRFPVHSYLEREHRAWPFFTINGLHSFLNSIHSVLSRDNLEPLGQTHLYEPAVLMQFAAGGQRKLPILHSSMSMHCSFSFALNPEKHSQR